MLTLSLTGVAAWKSRETPVARHPTENNQTEFTLRIRNAWSVVKALTQNVGMEFP